MTTQKLQCKNIETIPILEHIATHGGIGCSWFDLPDCPRSVRHAIPDGFNLPDRLVLAKIRQLIRTSLVKGCGCGCRGDFELTEKGREILENQKESS